MKKKKIMKFNFLRLKTWKENIKEFLSYTKKFERIYETLLQLINGFTYKQDSNLI